MDKEFAAKTREFAYSAYFSRALGFIAVFVLFNYYLFKLFGKEKKYSFNIDYICNGAVVSFLLRNFYSFGSLEICTAFAASERTLRRERSDTFKYFEQK